MNEPGPSLWLNREPRVVAMTGDEAGVGAEWLEAVMEASEGDHGQLSRACFARDQLQLVRRYLSICARLEIHGAKLLTKDPPLVPVDFSVPPLPNTRLCISEGIERSFALFCRHLHELTLTTEARRLAPMTPVAMSKLVAFVNEIACLLTDSAREVMDKEVSEATARERVATRCAEFAATCTETECARLRDLLDDCDGLEHALREFLTKRRLSPRQLARFGDDEAARVAAKARVVRTWAAGVVRRGRGGSLRALLARPAAAARVRAWSVPMGAAVRCVGAEFARRRCGARRDDDENANNDAAVYDAVVLVGQAVADLCATEAAVVRALLSQGAQAPCWSTLSVELDDISLATDRAPLLQAPGHLAVFSRGRLRVRARGAAPLGAELADVRLARAFETLLREQHLPLDRLGADYANRIVVCEYVKYERAVLSIETDTLEPLGDDLGIPYVSTVPDLATARRAQLP